MKRSVSIAATLAVISGGAMAADYNMACAKPGDDRVIEIIAPGQVGQACDVRYTRDAGANVSIPYHADNSQAFCLQKAAELVENLNQAGYACVPVIAPVVAEASPAQAPAPTVETLTQAQPVASDIDTVLIEQPPMNEPVVAAAPETTGALEEKMNLILGGQTDGVVVDEGPQAVRGPAQLAAETLEPVSSSSAVASSSLGRIVGAEPQEPVLPVTTTVVAASQTSGGVTPVTQAAFEEAPTAPEPVAPETTTTGAPAVSAPESDAPTATEDQAASPEPAPQPVATTPAPQPAKKADARIKPRTPEEITLATLNAQVAAWNEGNMDAFMDAYWKSDKLKFVSGNVVTQGWSATQKKYRERYGNGGDLGRLSLDKTDFVQVTDDVAIVTGRFNLVKDDAGSAGAFSLVMKRVDGMWRIAHDHTTEDPKPTQ